MLEVYLVVGGGVILGQLAPGPNLLAVAGAALASGRRPAFFLALGVACAVMVWVSVCVLGLATVLAVYPQLLVGMKLAGGLYLLYLALKAARVAASGAAAKLVADKHTISAAAAFRRGALINLTNPKSALMWTAVATFMFGAGLAASEVMAFAPIGSATAFAVYAVYAFVFSTGPARAFYARAAKLFEGLFAAAFGALGAALLWDGVRSASR